MFRRFCNETNRFLGCWYISLASKSCNEFFAVKLPSVFKLFLHRVNVGSDFATVIFHCFLAVLASCARNLRWEMEGTLIFTINISALSTCIKTTKMTPAKVSSLGPTKSVSFKPDVAKTSLFAMFQYEIFLTVLQVKFFISYH